jgi:rubrerythrin
MSTDPFVTIVPRKMTASELARAIRLDISAELDATNLYQAHIDATDDERAKAVLAHIRDEEKEHVSEFMQLLALLDPYQAEELQAAPQNVAQILAEGQVAGGAPGETPGGGSSSQERLTVGSLLGRGQG